MSYTFRVLGPIQIVWSDGVVVDPGTPKQRLLLAILLSHLGAPQQPERLMDGLWSASRPPSAAANLRSLVYRLRCVLGPAAVVRDGRGYTLAVEPAAVDATGFVAGIEAGRALLATAEVAAASAALHAALAQWRGEPYGDLAAEPALRVEVARLAEYYVTGLSDRIDADLAMGRHRDLVGELKGLVADHPYREGWHAQLMLALYRSGRQTEALQAFEAARTILAEELGLAPGPALAALHRAILRADPDLEMPVDGADSATGGSSQATRSRTSRPTRAPARPVNASGRSERPAQLPPDPRLFTGRSTPLAELDRLLSTACDGPVLAAIHGMGGIGKTALAVHWAHRVRDSFPDGQLYLNLRGFAPGKPMRVVDAVRHLLYALGVTAAEQPADLDDAVGLYRSLLADRRTLILLDNARDAEQVRPLLSGGPGTAILVTSRDRLRGLVARDDAQPVGLDVLAAADSAELLRGTWSGQSEPADTEVAEVAELCGHLPLALRIAAANLADQTPAGIHRYLKGLRSGDRLGGLAVDGDPHTAVQHTFDLSYRALSKPARRLLDRLALVPGDDVTIGAVAALGGVGPVVARARLDELVRRHLVDEDETGRIRLHDLVRAFAQDRVATLGTPAQAAYHRLVAWYAGATAAADAILRPATPPPPVGGPVLPEGCLPAFGDQAEASAWFDAEQANLASILSQPDRCPGQVWRTALSSRGWLQRRAPRPVWLEWYRHAIEAAVSDGAPAAEAALRTGIGIAHSMLRNRPEAVTAYRQAIELFAAHCDAPGELDAIASLGGLYADFGEADAALAHLRPAHVRLESMPDHPDLRFKVEVNLGFAYRRSGDDEAAMRFYRAAAATAERSLDGAWLLTTALSNIGTLQFTQGRLVEAESTFQRLMRLAQQTGDRTKQAWALDGLAEVAEAQGRLDSAAEHVRAAVEILEVLGDHNFGPMRERLARLVSAATDAREPRPHPTR